MKKKRLNLRGTILIVAAYVIGMAGISLNQGGAAPILFWGCIAGFCVLKCLGLAAFMEAYQQKKLAEIEKSNR